MLGTQINQGFYNLVIVNGTRGITVVEYNIQLIWLSYLDPPNKKYLARAALNYEWIDPRLSWNISEFDLELIQIPTAHIWTPIFQMVSSDEVLTLTTEYCVVWNTGLVRVNRIFLNVGHCVIISEYFPYDTHYCTMELYEISIDINLKAKPASVHISPAISRYHSLWWTK